jgi:hypothetical protein
MIMFKIFVAFVSGCIATVAAVFLLDRPVSPPPLEKSQSLQRSYDQLVESLAKAGDFVEGHRWYGSEREQAEAYRHIMRILISSLEERGLNDAGFPYFRVIRPRTKSGMDNSDQRYLAAALDGGSEYRVWGTRGSSRRLDFVLYEDVVQGRTLDALSTDDLEVAEDGSFALIISPERQRGNWLQSEAVPLKLLVRQIHSDWASELPGEVHVDRLGQQPGDAPRMNASIMAQRLHAVAEDFSTRVRHWPEFSRTRIAVAPANWLTPPVDTGDVGGLPGRLMVGGHFDLLEDEALIIKSYPNNARYQGIQLGHHWWESLDYADRQSSLTADQSTLSSDGAYYYVLAHRDPGVANWLDTEGFQRGVIFMRYDGMQPAIIPDGEEPSAQKVPFDEIRQQLPADEPHVSPRQRAAEIAIRRRHVQQRFGN